MTLPSRDFGSTVAAGADALAPPDDAAGAEAAGDDVAPGAALQAARMSITTATNAASREYLCIVSSTRGPAAPGDAGACTSLAPDAFALRRVVTIAYARDRQRVRGHAE